VKKEKREKKPLEGYVIATVNEFFRGGHPQSDPLRHFYLIRIVIPDPRCTVQVNRLSFRKSVYHFTKTTRIVMPKVVYISVYSRSFKKRDLIKDLNGEEFAHIGDCLSFMKVRKGKKSFVLEIADVENDSPRKLPSDITYTKKYQMIIKASDIKDRESVLRYLFKTTDEKLSRNFVS